MMHPSGRSTEVVKLMRMNRIKRKMNLVVGEVVGIISAIRDKIVMAREGMRILFTYDCGFLLKYKMWVMSR